MTTEFRLFTPPVDPECPKAIHAEAAKLQARIDKFAADRNEAEDARAKAEASGIVDLVVGNFGDPARSLAVILVNDELHIRRDLVAFAGRVQNAHRELHAAVPSWGEAREAAAELLRQNGWDVPQITASGSYGLLNLAVNAHPKVLAVKERAYQLSGMIQHYFTYRDEQDSAIEILETRIAEARRRLLASPV